MKSLLIDKFLVWKNDFLSKPTAFSFFYGGLLPLLVLLSDVVKSCHRMENLNLIVFFCTKITIGLFFSAFCVYNGAPFFKGQTWDDGCTKKCRCDDADNNIITCFDR